MADDWMFGCDKTAAVTEQESTAAADSKQFAKQQGQQAATQGQATASSGQTSVLDRQRQHSDVQLAGSDGQDFVAEGQTELNSEQSLAVGHSEHATGRLPSLHSVISFSNVLPPVPVQPGPQLQETSPMVATASAIGGVLSVPQLQQQPNTLQLAAVTIDASESGHAISSGQEPGFAPGAEEPSTDRQSAQQVLCTLCGTVACLTHSLMHCSTDLLMHRLVFRIMNRR